MKNKEEIDDSSLDTKEISQPEKKYIITSIILLSFLIIVFLVLIAEAYLNQHPVFSFLQYSVFKYESISIGSISIFIFFTGILFLGLALGLLLLPISRYKQIALNVIFLIEFTLLSSSFILFSLSYNWNLGWSKYISLICISSGLTIGLFKIILSQKSFSKLISIISFILCTSGISFFLFYGRCTQ